ncbi:hypothetical protein GQ53DRAFT_726749 [Thozetella sp. PMI_491]|nr:hypothetical protein GQ53DRAFT_726749 [Thozetella sp. PMI_491]
MSSLEDRIKEAAARNRELLALLSETDHAKPSLEEQERFIKNLRSEVEVSDHTLANLEKKRKKELKEHETYRDSVMRRFAYKATGRKEKFEQRAAKEEKEYFDVLQNEYQTKEKRKQLDQMLADALQVRDDLKGLQGRHDQAQRDLDNLYDAIFQGPSPGFPEEDSKEGAAGAALQSYHDARVRAEAEGQAVRILTDAVRAMDTARYAMDEARSNSQMDMFGGGAVWDMMERNALSRAEQNVGMANLLIHQASQMSPYVQPLPPVQIAQGSIISDVFFDNIFTDMAFHEKIKQSQLEVQRCHDVVLRNLNEARSRHAGLTQTMNDQAKILENARFELQKTREAAFRRVNGE